MEQLIELSHTELVMAFVASCIESTARRLDIPYQEVFARMKRINMIEDYILPYYDVLHTQSREYVTDNMIEYLNTWEGRQ